MQRGISRLSFFISCACQQHIGPTVAFGQRLKVLGEAFLEASVRRSFVRFLLGQVFKWNSRWDFILSSPSGLRFCLLLSDTREI